MKAVWARIAPGCHHGQPAEVMGPAFRMPCALLGTGQASVGQPEQRSVRPLDQVDLDEARPWRHLVVALPAEAVGEAMHWHHLAEGAAGDPSARDIEEIEPPE